MFCIGGGGDGREAVKLWILVGILFEDTPEVGPGLCCACTPACIPVSILVIAMLIPCWIGVNEVRLGELGNGIDTDPLEEPLPLCGNGSASAVLSLWLSTTGHVDIVGTENDNDVEPNQKYKIRNLRTAMV